MPSTTQFARDVRMKGIPMTLVMAGARQGIFSYLAELHYRICDSYTPPVLDVLLGHLKEPDPAAHPGVNQAFCAYLCLLALLQVAKACRVPSQRLLAAKKLIPALGGIVEWIYLVLCLERDQWCEGYPYSFCDVVKYEDVVLILLGLAGIDETVKKAIAANPLILDLAVVSWVAAPHGHPLLYASGNHLSAQNSDGPEEPTITFLHLIAETNPMGLGTTILNGRICSPERFFVRASQRMWALIQPNILPHLHHVSDIPTEDLNFTQVVRIVKALVDAHPDLIVPMLETTLPVYFMDALARAIGRAPAIQCRWGRMDYKETLLQLAVHVVQWAELRSSFFVSTAKKMISAGLLQLLDSCTSLADSQPDSAKPFRALAQMLGNWAASPRLFKRVSKAMAEHLFQDLHHECSEGASPNAGVIWRAFENDNRLSCAWKKSTRLQLCDNMAHRLRPTPEVVEPKNGGVCSGCRSVVYCSAYCQRQDWNSFHREECGAMRADYFGEAGRPGARLSLNARTFRATSIRSVYASNAKPGDETRVMLVNPVVDESVWYVPVSRYLQIMGRAVPEHLGKRFEQLVQLFTESNADEGDAYGFSAASPRSVGLVHATFRYSQDAEDGIIILFKKSEGGSDPHVCPYDPATGFEVEASMAYRIQDPLRLEEALKLIPPAVENQVQAARPEKDRCAIYDCRVSEERQIHCHCEACNPPDHVHEDGECGCATL